MSGEEKIQPIREVQITASAQYPVWIGSGLLGQVGQLVRSIKKPCKAAIISDYTTGGLFENKVERSLVRAGYEVSKRSLPPGEQTKTMSRLAEVLEFLGEEGLGRSDLVIGLGGGVIGDLAGFAAAVYQRGIDCVQIPTTFLAAIDSSVGGKTAVDLGAGKNLAGAFHQPAAVICDCDVFRTLPEQVFADGAAEAVKYGVLAGGSLFSLLAQGMESEQGRKPGIRPELLPEIVEQCVRIKAGIVGRDEFDRGERQLLNLGHTAGHAIEHCSHFSVTHGRAVAIGMAIVSRAAEAKGILEPGGGEQICSALRVQGLPTTTELPLEKVHRASLADKKKTGDTMQIIVPQRIGCCQIQKMSAEEWMEWLRIGMSAGMEEAQE